MSSFAGRLEPAAGPVTFLPGYRPGRAGSNRAPEIGVAILLGGRDRGRWGPSF